MRAAITAGAVPLRIAGLSLYPVKSCAGFALERAEIRIEGLAAPLARDREWMIADSSGRFVTQRECPALARIRVAPADSGIVLQAPGMSPLHVAARSGPAREVVIWRDTVAAVDAGDHAARWLLALLDRDVRLVCFDRSRRRRCNPAYAGDSGAHTFFADGYPVLLIGTGSLSELNRRLAIRGQSPVSMTRFRPNVIVDGLEPHDEDHIERITAGSMALRLVKGCTRCTVTTIDPETGKRGDEPLAELARYRMNPRLGGVTFGMNAIVEREGSVAAGDTAQAAFVF